MTVATRPERLATEADLVRSLDAGCFTLDELYERCEQHVDVRRDNGTDSVGHGHGSDTRWKRRLRCALQAAKRQGRARRLDGARWAIEGDRRQPRRMLLVWGATIAEFELRLQAAHELLETIDEPVDLVLADPPYALDRGGARDRASRSCRERLEHVVDGYVDVPGDEYLEFSHRWIAAARGALRPGGTLAVVTGPQRAAHVQVAAEQAGLQWVSSIAAYKAFPLRATRQPAVAHWTITVMCHGRRDHPRRTFNPPPAQVSRTGNPYPLDWWPSNGRADRPGLLRYDNTLPLRLAKRLVRTFSDEGDLVCDPFLGGGSTARACWTTARRFVGGDLNPGALRFTAGLLLTETGAPCLP